MQPVAGFLVNRGTSHLRVSARLRVFAVGRRLAGGRRLPIGASTKEGVIGHRIEFNP